MTQRTTCRADPAQYLVRCCKPVRCVRASFEFAVAIPHPRLSVDNDECFGQKESSDILFQLLNGCREGGLCDSHSFGGLAER